MGCGPSKTEEGAAHTIPPPHVAQSNGAVKTPNVPAESFAKPREPDVGRGARNDAYVEEPPAVRNESLGSRWSRAASLQSQTSRQGFANPPGVYVPSSGFKTPELCKLMVEKYDMPESEVQKAMEFAESEEFVDVYCFTYCITGGPMEPTAFKVAGLQGMDKEAILQWATAPGNEDLRVLNVEEQQRHKKARDDFLVSKALQPEQEEEEDQPEDMEELTEAYRIRFEADTENMSLEEVMEYFGVPEVSKVAIHKHLHPARGAATATIDEIARRKAAHPIALERFDALA